MASCSVPNAENCLVVPGAMLDDADDVTVINDTGELVSMVVPVIPNAVADMIVEPVAAVTIASPFDPDVLLIAAVPTSDELQVAAVVRFSCVLLE